MKTVTFINEGGVDWHDVCTTHTLLTEREDSANIVDVNAVVSHQLYKLIFDMRQSDETGTLTLRNVPSEGEIMQSVSSGTDIELSSGKGSDGYAELNFKYTAKDMTVEMDYYKGQCSYTGSFEVTEISDDEVRYTVIENFLAPVKGISSVQRFYEMPYTDYAKARKAMASMKLHGGYWSVAEMIVTSQRVIDDSGFFRRNIRCIEAEHNGVKGEFSPFVERQEQIYGIVDGAHGARNREEKSDEQDQNQKYFDYLEQLRESGETNMWGAVPYLQKEFPELGFDKARAKEIHSTWMKSYQEGTEQ